jgi:hypothetical protein
MTVDWSSDSPKSPYFSKLNSANDRLSILTSEIQKAKDHPDATPEEKAERISVLETKIAMTISKIKEYEGIVSGTIPDPSKL